MDIQVNDILTMKKQHPCGSKQWQVLRIGMDFRLKCLGCGHEHNCGVHGCAIAREAAVRLNLYEHALEQVAKERDTLLAQLKSLGGCMGCIGHMNPEARLCTDCDEAFRAWQWNGGASHDRP